MRDVLSRLKSAFKRRSKEEAENEPLAEPLEAEGFTEVPRIAESARKLFKAKMRPLDLYPLYQPWAYAHIVEDLNTGNITYLVEEVSLNKREAQVYKDIIDYITWELEPPKGTVDLHDYLLAYAKKALRLFQIRLGRTPGLSWSKIGYYIERDLLGYGKLDPIFRDENIEDISCNGPRKPVYVWHRKYESLPTNIVFNTEDELDEYVLKLAHMAGKHISVAYPILDAILPGGHRVAATFQKEVSTSGSTFTIRKFREDPITVIDMINFGTISSELAAYFWLAMDYKMTSLILGVTGAGKSVSGMTRMLAVLKGIPGVYTLHEVWKVLQSKAVKVSEGAEVIFDPEVLVRTCDPVTLKCGWRRPKAFIKHRNDKRMLRVRFRSGRYVDITEDHSLIILKEGSLKTSPPTKGVIGSLSPIPLNHAPASKVTSKTLISFLSGEHTYVVITEEAKEFLESLKDELGLKEILGLIEYGSESGLRNAERIRVAKLRNLLHAAKELPRSILISGSKGEPLPLNVLTNPEFTELLGIYVGGAFSAASPTETSVYFLKKAFSLYRDLVRSYHLHSRRLGENYGFTAVKATLTAIIKDLVNSGSGGIFPPIYWVMPNEWKTTFLKGFLEICGVARGGVLEIITDTEAKAWELLIALSELGIHARISQVDEGGPRFRVEISESSAPKIIKSLFARHPKKESLHVLSDSAAYTIISGSMKPSTEVGALNVQEATATQSLMRKSLDMGFYEGLMGEELIGGADGSIGFDEIVEVEEIPPEEYVYDFEVPGTQNFEGNNVIVHNTSTLNALANLLRPTYKVVTIEDTPELRLPQENWVQLVSRPSYLAGGGVGEITLFHLVKVSLRYRPDVIIVGEVRGEEAYVLFQAIATGHSGMTTLHAESIDAAVKRLTSPPMNIPPSYIPLVNFALVIKRLVMQKEGGKPRPVRRVTNVWEIRDYEHYDEVARWDPVRDIFELNIKDSLILRKVGEMTGKGLEELIEEISRRKAILEWLATNNIRSYRQVATYVQRYYLDPEEVLKDIGAV